MFTRTDRPGSPAVEIPLGVRWGVGLAFGAALISGLAIYLNGFAVKQMADAAVFTTLKNAVAAIILITAAVGVGGIQGVRAIDRRQWPAVVLVGVIGGSVPFILFFSGLAQASAPSAAFIQKTLFIWVALLAVPFLGERLGIASFFGLCVLLAGQALILPPAGITWGTGETLILAATVFWAIETVLVRRLLGSIPGSLMAALRMGVGLIVLVAYVVVAGKLSIVAGLSAAQWGWVLLTGLVLAGYVGTWFAALQRAPASVVTSVLVPGAVVTGVLNAASNGAAPSPTVVLGYLLIIAAASLVAVSALRAASLVAASGGRPTPITAVAD